MVPSRINIIKLPPLVMVDLLQFNRAFVDVEPGTLQAHQDVVQPVLIILIRVVQSVVATPCFSPFQGRSCHGLCDIDQVYQLKNLDQIIIEDPGPR